MKNPPARRQGDEIGRHKGLKQQGAAQGTFR